jgi:hypothetical protein
MSNDQKVKKPGMPPFKPTEENRKMVEAMSSFGMPQAQICTVLDIDPKTLRKYFREELDKAMIKANAKVAANLFRQATKDDFKATTAAIFWSKTRMGWKEPVHMEHSGSLSVNFKGMSDDELDDFIAEQTGNLSGSFD